MAELNALTRQNGDNRLKRELLLFWGTHPKGQFTESVICYALDYNKLDMDKMLKLLVETGLVDTEIHDGVTWYSLTTDEERRQAIVEFTRPGHN